jgi:MFS family permease
MSSHSSCDESAVLTPSSCDEQAAKRTLRNFVTMAILFSANHGCTVSCLALATARLGSVGAWQSGVLYFTYTASAILGATYITKTLGSRNSIIAGMALYCAYVGCFLIATVASSTTILANGAALLGAAIGGVGGGFLWTAQGSYFGQASEEHGTLLQQDVKLSTAYFAGIFAFVYLAEEVLLRILSSALLETGRISWSAIFAVYTAVAVVSTLGMVMVHNYPKQQEEGVSVSYKMTVAVQLLRGDPKMKYMIGLNASFGLAGAFLNSYVNGEVVRVALNDPASKYVGGLSALVAAVAAIMSLVLARVAQRYGKGPVLVAGALCFFGVVFPFVVQPNAVQWGWGGLIMVYTLQGIGRATFESTLKATFADYFPYEKEGAFANIILQNGLSSAFGYILSFRLLCDKESKYCVEFRDGSLHDVLSFELLVVVSVIFAIGGYWRASILYEREQEPQNEYAAELILNQTGVSAYG